MKEEKEERRVETTIQENKRKQQEAQQAAFDKMVNDKRRDVETTIGNSEAALRVFRQFFQLCGGTMSSLFVDEQGHVNADVMLMREARRALWLEFRQYIPRPLLIEIEYPEPKEEIK